MRVSVVNGRIDRWKMLLQIIRGKGDTSMNMENVTSVLNSADGPTSIFVAAKTPEMMGVLIATVVVGVIIALFGLKIARVISAIIGLGAGAVIGAVIAMMVGLDMTKTLATIAVCGVVLGIMCAVLRKFGIFVMAFLGSFGTFITLLRSKSLIVLGICAVVALIVAILTVIFAEFLVIFVTGIMGGVEAGMALPVVLGMTKISWIGYVMSAAIAVIGIIVQTMMQSRKIGKKEKIFSKKIKEQVSMESEVEKARMLLDDGDVEESPEEEPEAGEQEDQGETEETVTEIFDIDDDKPEPEDTDNEENADAGMPDVPEGGFLDEDDVEIFETDDSDVVVLHADDID